MQENKSVKTYGFIVFAIMLSKLLGLFRDALMANFYGTGLEAAAFSAASRIPLTIFDITLGTAVAAAFIPVLNEYLGQGDKRRGFEFINNFLNMVLLAAVIITALMLLFPGQVIGLLASGFTSDRAALASSILIVLAPIVILASVCYTFVGVLQSFGSFKIPAVMSLLSNAVMVIYFFTLNKQFGIMGLGVSLVIGWVLQLLILLPVLIKNGYRFKFGLNFHDSGVNRSVKMAGPVLISSWVMPINSLITLNLASYFGNFGVPALDYSYKLYFIVAGVFSFAMTNLYFPSLSRLNSAGETGEANRLLVSMLKNVTIIIIPVMAFFMVFCKNIVSVIYQNGAFTKDDVFMVSVALVVYTFGMFGFSWQEILNKFFYSMKDSKTPMIVALFSILINVVFAILLSKVFGIYGIAAGASISITFAGGALYIILKKRSLEVKNNGKIVAFLIKMLISFVASIIIFYLIQNILNIFDFGKIIMLLCLVVCFIVGICIYVLVLKLLKIDEVSRVFGLLKKGLGKAD